MMDFTEYEKRSGSTAQYPDKGKSLVYPTLGLVGEAGEVAEKVKKILRDKKGKINVTDRNLLKKELGDVLWYITAVARELGIPLEDVARTNLRKLESRVRRGKIGGSGDLR
jgi:NTP pyrophosphatase (non-canonical NTP hydrolase)